MNERTLDARPIASLGLPVYNGEKYIAKTLDAILQQTFTRFEVIISDNASSDATRMICEEYANNDNRIQYIRHTTNRGAAANYNFVFSQAKGHYFKWCPHDDILAKNYLELCIKALEVQPEAVGAITDVSFIDGDGSKIEDVPLPIHESHQSALTRFSEALDARMDWLLFFGLFNRDLVARTGLHGNYIRSDNVFVSEMLLMGPIIHVPNSGLHFRRHNSSFTDSVLSSQDDAIAWMDPNLRGTRTLKESRYYFETVKVILRSNISLGEKLVCLQWTLSAAWKRKRKVIFRELLLPFYRNGKKTKLHGFFRRLVKKS